MKKQLILISDMEGVSGIFDSDLEELINGSEKMEKIWQRKNDFRYISSM